MAKQKQTFEQAMDKLERIVAEIEQGEVPLEKSIDRYAEGIELIKHCRGVIEQAEKKIQLLAKTQGDALRPDGELDEADEDAGAASSREGLA